MNNVGYSLVYFSIKTQLFTEMQLVVTRVGGGKNGKEVKNGTFLSLGDDSRPEKITPRSSSSSSWRSSPPPSPASS